MHVDEADYKNIFKQLYLDDTLKLGSSPHSPTPRLKARRG
jgi:hypothetical protein